MPGRPTRRVGVAGEGEVRLLGGPLPDDTQLGVQPLRALCPLALALHV
jgi:hypothetical protein